MQPLEMSHLPSGLRGRRLEGEGDRLQTGLGLVWHTSCPDYRRHSHCGLIELGKQHEKS